MIMSCIEIVPADNRRQDILQILQFVESAVRTNPGCTCTAIYEKLGQNDTILYVEQWESERELRSRIQSRAYLPILNAIDLAREEPKISFHEVTSTRSMELIEELRTCP